jgi:hypothetical protein
VPKVVDVLDDVVPTVVEVVGAVVEVVDVVVVEVVDVLVVEVLVVGGLNAFVTENEPRCPEPPPTNSMVSSLMQRAPPEAAHE